MSNRKMIQVFLEHLWFVWRLMEGYDVRMPFPIEKLKHGTYIKPFIIPDCIADKF